MNVSTNYTVVASKTADQRSFEQTYLATLPMNGGVFVGSGSATVDVWCRVSGINSGFWGGQQTAQIMATQVGGFF